MNNVSNVNVYYKVTSESENIKFYSLVYNNDGDVGLIKDTAQEEDDEFLSKLIEKHREDLLDEYDEPEEDW